MEKFLSILSPLSGSRKVRQTLRNQLCEVEHHLRAGDIPTRQVEDLLEPIQVLLEDNASLSLIVAGMPLSLARNSLFVLRFYPKGENWIDIRKFLWYSTLIVFHSEER